MIQFAFLPRRFLPLKLLLFLQSSIEWRVLERILDINYSILYVQEAINHDLQGGTLSSSR